MPNKQRIFKKEMVEDFLKSKELFRFIDWRSLGYSNLKNACLCMKANLDRYEYQCSCQMCNEKIYFVKEGYKLRKLLRTNQIYVSPIGFTTMIKGPFDDGEGGARDEV